MTSTGHPGHRPDIGDDLDYDPYRRHGEVSATDNGWHDDDSRANARLRRSMGLTALAYAAAVLLSVATCIGFAAWLINTLLTPAGD